MHVPAERGRSLLERKPAPATLIAARVCYLEAEWRRLDCAAILYAAARRARAALGSAEWLGALEQYSAPAMRRLTDQRRAILERERGQWTGLIAFVGRVLAGKVANPCPGASHFGGSMDHAQGRMMPAACSSKTVNAFYVLAAR